MDHLWIQFGSIQRSAPEPQPGPKRNVRLYGDSRIPIARTGKSRVRSRAGVTVWQGRTHLEVMSRCEAFKPRNMFVCPRISKNTPIENQAAAITAYASERKIEIVKTYVDKGRSGLRINSRKNLQKLIADVQGHIHRHLRADAKEASAPDRSPALPPLLRRAASLEWRHIRGQFLHPPD